MKQLRFYVWFGAFIFLANGWLCYVLSSWKISSSDQPIWQNALTEIALISQLPSLPLSRIVADFFDLSYPGWAITTSVISIFIYFPLVHLVRPGKSPRVKVRSVYRKVTDFSSSLNPCGSARKNHPSSAAPSETNSLSHSEKHA